MNTEELKKIIVDQQEETKEYFAREKIIDRDIDQSKLKNFLSSPNILVISGVRRSGKSTLALQLLQDKNRGYLNFDDERLAGFNQDNFNKMLEAFYELYGSGLEHFIFDEIQNIPGWELFLNRLRRNKKIIITGSNANLLSGELASRLTGRYLDFNLYPFSFKEFLKFKGLLSRKKDVYTTKETARLKTALEEKEIPTDVAEISMVAQNTIQITDEDVARKIINLMEAFDDHDDVQNAYANFDISDEILQKLDS